MKISVTEIEFQQSFVRCYTRYYAQQNSIIFSIFVVVVNNQTRFVRHWNLLKKQALLRVQNIISFLENVIIKLLGENKWVRIFRT